MNLDSKLPNVGTTIFAIMSGLAHETGAINLSQGFPDFQPNEKLIKLVNRYMERGMNQYPPMPGVIKLREKISEKTEDCYGVYYNPADEITVTSGATQGLFNAITSVTRPGDEVIIFEPAYDSYKPVIELAGGKAIPIALSYPDYKIPLDELKDKINSKTRLIITNNPHNPTGSVWTEEDLNGFAEVVLGSDAYVLSDEVYEHIVFDGLKHQTAMFHEDLRRRSFILSSFGKTYHTTGWKLGYCLAPPELTREFRKIHQFVVFASPSPFQYAFADFLDQKNEYLDLPAFYEKRRDKFVSLMKPSRFEFKPCSGTYFQLLSYKGISDEGDMEFAQRITREKGVASIPISVFFSDKRDEKVLRFCFAKKDETLTQAAEILCQI